MYSLNFSLLLGGLFGCSNWLPSRTLSRTPGEFFFEGPSGMSAAITQSETELVIRLRDQDNAEVSVKRFDLPKNAKLLDPALRPFVQFSGLQLIDVDD